MEDFISGAITGGITDPQSARAMKHAVLYYEEIRKNHSDVEKIAKNTGFTYDQVLLVKNYLFMDAHDLGGSIQRFDESFEIAESWRRMAFSPADIQNHDITLLNHELMEMRLVNEGLTQDEAHIITSRKFNYAEESFAYYRNLRIEINHDENMVSGAITMLEGNTH